MADRFEDRGDVLEAELDPEMFEAVEILEWCAHKNTNTEAFTW